MDNDIDDGSHIPGGSFVENYKPILPPAHQLQVVHPERSVWVLARPIRAAGDFGFLSEGKFPVCHWALLASESSAISFKVRWDSKARIKLSESWGTLFELFRDENDKNRVHEVQHFGANMEFISEWRTVAITFIGNSCFSDADLSAQGKRSSRT